MKPSRQGFFGQLVACVTSLEVEPITGEPPKPTTQGKNESFHQTLFRFLDKQSLGETLKQMQEQVDRFDQIDNTERPHQGLSGRITPAKAWEVPRKRSRRVRSRAAALCRRLSEIAASVLTPIVSDIACGTDAPVAA